MRKTLRVVGALSALVLPCWVLTGCGGEGGGASVREQAVLAELAQEFDGTSIDAATATATNSLVCKNNGNFYWEIGTRTGVLASGSVNNTTGGTVTSSSSLGLASASKIVFGAYVSETCGGLPCTTPGNPVSARDALRMLSANKSPYSVCQNRSINPTIDQCASAAGLWYDSAADGVFSYNGGQFMAFARGEPHLAGLNAAGMARELNSWLGGTSFSFGSGNPWLAGGGVSTPANMATFLQRILLSAVDDTNGLKLYHVLGADSVDASRAASDFTPVTQQNWRYSYGHWVENAGGNMAAWDGAFSSPGATGFYPWISRDKSVYGMVARGGSNFFQSVLCGQAIRRAFYTGQEQP